MLAETAPRSRRSAALLLLAASMPTSTVAATDPVLTVDGRAVPGTLFDAFVRNRALHDDACRALPPEHHRADFVRMLLQARAIERDERLRHE